VKVCAEARKSCEKRKLRTLALRAGETAEWTLTMTVVVNADAVEAGIATGEGTVTGVEMIGKIVDILASRTREITK
jgi:hypothetical protein